MQFMEYYFTEKTLNANDPNVKFKGNDKICVLIGQKIAKRFGLLFNGWMEMTYIFTIPKGVPNERNTLMAKNEEELVQKLQQRFPQYLEYIMNKNFPNGYEPDPSIPKEPPAECEPLDLASLKKSFTKGS